MIAGENRVINSVFGNLLLSGLQTESRGQVVEVRGYYPEMVYRYDIALYFSTVGSTKCVVYHAVLAVADNFYVYWNNW
jgi:hypothetical protein